MKIGLGLPNAAKSLTDGPLLIDIARRADELGYSTLATIGRVAFPSFEELVTLAAAAGATESNVIGYYSEYGPRVWQGTIKTADEAKARVKAYEAIGCDQLILFMTAPAVEQAERLAEAVL